MEKELKQFYLFLAVIFFLTFLILDTVFDLKKHRLKVADAALAIKKERAYGDTND